MCRTLNSFFFFHLFFYYWHCSASIVEKLDDSSTELHSFMFQLTNECPYPIDVIWVDTTSETAEHYPMLTLGVNETQTLTSYEGHQFLFQSFHQEDLSSSFFYTKLGDDELLILYHDDAVGLSFIQQNVVQPTYRPVTRLPPLTLNEKFENYVFPDPETSFKVHNNASDIIYIFLWKNDTNEALFLGSILPHEEDSFIGPEGQRNVLFEYIKIPFEESLIITNSPESSFYKMEIESSFNDYLEFISSLLSYCGYLNKHGDIVDQVTAEMVSCLSEGTFTEIDRLLSQRLLLLGMRDTMAPSLRNYTCGDDRLQTSKPIEISEESIHDGQYQVQTLFQMDSAQIFLVPNFLTVNECEALVETSRPRLERAAVVGENGAAVYSESRRAQQAAYTLSGPTDPLWNLYGRILNFTNSHTNYDLHLEGQEQFTVIQYNPTDEYLSHCDGDCDGSIHRSTGRVATAVLYCKIPELGGATSFTKADVFVRPEPLAAAFFTYMGPDGRLDIGYTEHSGCPIREGEKWIATAWMREGVSLEHPHSLYDPSGFRNGDPNDFNSQVAMQSVVQVDGS